MYRTIASSARPVILILLCICTVSLHTESSRKALLVADFASSGISQSQTDLIVDLFSYLFYENSSFLVMSRYERNKLLKGFGYRHDKLKETDVYMEAAELLRVSYVLTGSCIYLQGKLSLFLQLRDVETGDSLIDRDFSLEDVSGLITHSRDIVMSFLSSFNFQNVPSNNDEGGGMYQSLYVRQIRERILIALPEPGEAYNTEIAALRFQMNQAGKNLEDNKCIRLLFTSLQYEPENFVPGEIQHFLTERDFHSLAVVSHENSRWFLIIYSPDFSERFRIPLDPRKSREKGSADIIVALADLPQIPTSLIAGELLKENRIKEKLDLLLFNERFLSRNLWISIHQSIFKSAIVNKFHPLLNISSLETDVYWFYSDLFGVGLGYAFSLGYPATIDTKLTAHPLVNQHEIRFIPLAFRSSGPVSILLELSSSLCFQDAYTITYFKSIDKYEYTDKTILRSIKTGLSMGLIYTLNDTNSIFVDLASIHAVFPLNSNTVTYDGSRISGDIGGVGVIIRL